MPNEIGVEDFPTVGVERSGEIHQLKAETVSAAAYAGRRPAREEVFDALEVGRWVGICREKAST